MEKSKWLRISFRLILIVSCATGILMTLLFQRQLLRSLSYFTVQSNLFVLGFVIMEMTLRKPEKKWVSLIRLAVFMAILTTFTVYHLMLRPMLIQTPGYDFPPAVDFLVHTLTPILAILDSLFFSPKGRMRFRDVWVAIVIPIFYIVYINLYAAFGGTFEFDGVISRFPYYFLDIDQLGVGRVFGISAGIAILILAVGSLVIGCDIRLAKRLFLSGIAENPRNGESS